MCFQLTLGVLFYWDRCDKIWHPSILALNHSFTNGCWKPCLILAVVKTKCFRNTIWLFKKIYQCVWPLSLIKMFNHQWIKKKKLFQQTALSIDRIYRVTVIDNELSNIMYTITKQEIVKSYYCFYQVSIRRRFPNQISATDRWRMKTRGHII